MQKGETLNEIGEWERQEEKAMFSKPRQPTTKTTPMASS